jgi:flagellar biosynthesis/type III secretory pathway M-ring protein FliF/YscJ
MNGSLTTVIAQGLLVEETVDPQQQQALISEALPIAGIFLAVLGIVLLILWKSMNKQMRKINESLPPGRDDREQALDRELTEEAVARGEAQEAQEAPSDETPPDKPGTSGT